jgi:hypothetical protein
VLELKFSTDFVNFLFIHDGSIPFPVSTQNIILPFTKPAISRNHGDEIMAHGTFMLPEINGRYTITISTTTADKPMQVRNINIPAGLWNFNEFKAYLNHCLGASLMSVHFPVNYEYSNMAMFLTHFYYGTMQFSNDVNENNIRLITFDKNIENALKISKPSIEIPGNSKESFATEYRIPILLNDEIIQEYTAPAITYSGLNSQQSTFIFKEKSISLMKPAGKHEYTNYKLKVDDYLGVLLGVGNNWLQFDYNDDNEYKCSGVLMIPQNKKIIQQHACHVYTDIIQENERTDEQYKLLRQVSSVSPSIIYPIIYLKISQHRINHINIKIVAAKDAAIDSATIVLHFIKKQV